MATSALLFIHFLFVWGFRISVVSWSVPKHHEPNPAAIRHHVPTALSMQLTMRGSPTPTHQPFANIRLPNSSKDPRRLERDVGPNLKPLTAHDEQLLRQLDRYDPVSAVLHHLEILHSRRSSIGSNSPHNLRPRCNRTSASFHHYQFGNFSYQPFLKQAAEAVRTANILSSFFTKVPNESDDSFLYSLVKANLRSYPLICASGIAFQRGDPIAGDDSLFYPYALRRGHRIVTFDLSETANFSYDSSNVYGTEWFSRQASKNLTEISSMLFGWNASVAGLPPGAADPSVTMEDGVWSLPYLDCGGTDAWVITFSAPFYGKRNGTLEFRGVATVSIDLEKLGVNQCAKEGSLFADSHKCHRESTECVQNSRAVFRRGNYKCRCRQGFYFPSVLNATSSSAEVPFFAGVEVEEAFVNQLLAIKRDTLEGNGHANVRKRRVGGVDGSEAINFDLDHFRCLPCRTGCASCIDGSPCRSETNLFLRSLVLGLQSFSTTLTAVLGFVIFRLRKSKTIANAMWVMLETMLFGALLLYQTVIIRYFEASTLTCLIEPWFREIGFAVCYGAILLKIYRILAEFQTRKAHRVCVRDKDLLKYLLGIILVVVGYMAAWTAVVMENIGEGHSIVEHGKTADGLAYAVCKALWWDYITETGEAAFLILGVYLTYCIRNAKRDIYNETCTLCWSIYIELVFSAILYCIRHIVWLKMDPDYLFFMYFLRCQITVSIVLILIFTPKLWYHHRPPETLEGNRGRHFSTCDIQEQLPEAMKLHEAIMTNGELDFSDINLADMDPEDIRLELRRVYTQLQVLRNKTMRKDNPHISKRRGGRKVTHRRFSLQPFHHKHKHQHPMDHDNETTEVSKTPEDSTASLEGATTTINPLTAMEVPTRSEEQHGQVSPLPTTSKSTLVKQAQVCG